MQKTEQLNESKLKEHLEVGSRALGRCNYFERSFKNNKSSCDDFAATWSRVYEADYLLYKDMIESNADAYYQGPDGAEFDEFGPPVQLGPQPFKATPAAHPGYADNHESWFDNPVTSYETFLIKLVCYLKISRAFVMR